MTTIESYQTVRVGTRRQRTAAWLGLAAACLLARLLPLRWIIRTARIARLVGRRPLTPDQALVMVEAARHAGRRWPIRVACFEAALAAPLAAALLGRRLSWCLGARIGQPMDYHSWARVPDGPPVGEYTGDGWHYLTALEI